VALETFLVLESEVDALNQMARECILLLWQYSRQNPDMSKSLIKAILRDVFGVSAVDDTQVALSR
jgi:hypothetical protein